MKITIRLRYQTRFGQALYLCGNHELFGAGRQENALPLRYLNEDFWELTLELTTKQAPATAVSYYFFLRDVNGSVIEDFGGDRKLDFATLPSGHTVIVDSWNDVGTVANVFFTEPFRNILPRAQDETTSAAPDSHAYCFNVKAPLLPKGQTMCLLGSAIAMGGWNQAGLLLMQRCLEDDCFRVQLEVAQERFPVTYKYGVCNTEKKKFLRYEDGPNRTLAEAAPKDGRLIINDGFARLPSTLWRGAGVAIPVFSLRSSKSFGVGEFLDLPLLADWAKQAGLKVIQILPVNDTITTNTWMDSYPYNSISAFALHPLYLNLDRVAGNDDMELLESLAPQREKLNAMAKVDYEAVIKAKLAFLREIFPTKRKQTMVNPEYQQFIAQNKTWLEPYAAFCFLRDKFGAADFTQWPEHAVYDTAKIAALAEDDGNAAQAMAFHYFTQFHLHLQLREAAGHLHTQGLVLKGDIAIGVAAHGADVWQEPELFHTDMQTGAPPDAFAVKGQNWGFPTYNWPTMTRDGFAWWKRRFAQMSCYFDAFRIDHILGFFRIWSIPRNAVEGILGYFVPAKPVPVAEFEARGIPFDYERLTSPFINDSVLREIFGDKADAVKLKYLNPTGAGKYSLKPKFSTQREVEKYFASAKKEKDGPRLQEGLFDLISNVLLIEAPGSKGKEFHFRLGMEQTPSFRQLDPVIQSRLKDLYVEYFFRWQDAGWMKEALPKLSALKRVTNMLICGEDLGMVPGCVPVVMKRLGLLGLEIQRMPKALGVNFSRPADAPYLSVVTPSTHDMSTIRGWWLEDRKLTESFFKQELKLPGEAPAQCEPWVHREIVRQHLDSPAMLSIFQLQDLLGMDAKLRRPDIEAERINVPAIPRYYWRYRMHLPLETLTKAATFTKLVKDMVQQSER